MITQEMREALANEILCANQNHPTRAEDAAGDLIVYDHQADLIDELSASNLTAHQKYLVCQIRMDSDFLVKQAEIKVGTYAN